MIYNYGHHSDTARFKTPNMVKPAPLGHLVASGSLRLDFSKDISILPTPMDSLIQRFRQELGRKQYDALDETWFELLEHRLPVAVLLRLIDLVEQWGPPGKALFLLGLLNDDLRDRNQLPEQLTVLRRLARLAPTDPALSRDTAECLRRLYPQLDILDRLLQKVGLGYGTPLDRALADFDLHISLLPGTLVYSQQAGPGHIINLDLLLGRVTVRWYSGTENTLNIAAAGKQLRPLRPDGFFSLLKTAPAELSQLCAADPGKAVALFLRDVGRRVSVSEIRAAFGQLIPDADWNAFWEKARRALATNPHIQVATSPSRSYSWQDEPTTPETESVSDSPRIRKTVSDIDRLKTVTPDEITREYETLNTATARRQLLERIRTARPNDWKQVYAKLFRIGRDNRSRELIRTALETEDPSLWQKLVENTLTGYRQSPEAFTWLLSNADRLPSVSPRGLISRALDLLESHTYHSHWGHLRRAIAMKEYQLIARTIDELDVDDARRLLERIQDCHNIEEFRRQKMTELFTARFPQLLEPDDTTVWSTAAGIEKARAELRELTERELPAVADELARARSHGDLSENYEYKAAREKQNRLMLRINRLREELGRAKVIEPRSVDTTTVTPGCRVLLRDSAGNEHAYTILGPWDADPDQGIISHQSPLARQLLGLKQGDTLSTSSGSLQITAITVGLPV